MHWPSELRLLDLQKYRAPLTHTDLGLTPEEFEELMRDNLEAEKERKRKLEADDLGLSLEAYDELLRESVDAESRRKRRRRVNVGAQGETRRDVINIPGREQYPPGTIGAMMQRTKMLPQAGTHGERTQRPNVGSSSSSTPLLQAYMCPILGDHIIIFTTLNSITRMFYKSHGRSGLQDGAQRVFDLFTNIWFEAKGFSTVSRGYPNTRTLQKYSWSDDFLLEENFERNSRFFVDKIVQVTRCSVEEGRRALDDFCRTYSSPTFTKNEVLSVLLRTLCKSNDNHDSWKIGVQLSMCSEAQPLFFSTSLGQLFWRMQRGKMYDLDVSVRSGNLLSPTQESIDNSHLLLNDALLVNPSENFLNNTLEAL